MAMKTVKALGIEVESRGFLERKWKVKRVHIWKRRRANMVFCRDMVYRSLGFGASGRLGTDAVYSSLHCGRKRGKREMLRYGKEHATLATSVLYFPLFIYLFLLHFLIIILN